MEEIFWSKICLTTVSTIANLQLLSPDIILSLSCHLNEGKLVKRLNPIVWVNNGIRIILSWTPETTGLLSLSLSLCLSLSLSLFAEVAPYKNLLVTRCRSCSLQKFTRYSLQIRSLLIAEVARCKKPLVTRCRSCSLQNSLVVKNRSLFVAKFDRYLLHKFFKNLNLVMDDKI